MLWESTLLFDTRYGELAAWSPTDAIISDGIRILFEVRDETVLNVFRCLTMK